MNIAGQHSKLMNTSIIYQSFFENEPIIHFSLNILNIIGDIGYMSNFNLFLIASVCTSL